MHPTAYDIPLRGAEQSGLWDSVVASYGPVCWLACPTGSKGIAMASPNGHVVGPLIRFARCPFPHLPFAMCSAAILPAVVVSWFCL